MADGATGIKTVQRVPVPSPQATINTDDQSRRGQAEGYANQGGLGATEPETFEGEALQRLREFANAQGDISALLDPGVVSRIGVDAVRQWEIDGASRESWKEMAERSLRIAAQEGPDEDDDQRGDGLWDNSADIHYPLLTEASQQFAARALPELIKGDQVVGVKAFTQPQKRPASGEIGHNGAPPMAAQPGAQPGPQAQAQQQAVAQAQQAEAQQALADDAREARAARVKQYMNWTIFYKMDDWEGDTDLLLHQIPITGSAFRKVYMGTSGLCSDYVSALRLTVHNDTKSIYRCPRITEEFEPYPYEIDERQRAGFYRADVELPYIGEDPESPRCFIEQHRMDDLDGDGMAEPYVVTVDIDTKSVMRIEPAYTEDDITVRHEQDPETGDVTRKVIRIDRWNAYASYLFLPDPRGKFYGIGFGRLLESITDSVDTIVNQLLDAGTAEIAGGGFIASGVRLQGSGQGGMVTQAPGEFATVGVAGNDLKNAIWERTLPHPSAVSLKLFQLLLAAAKDVASVKDVMTGNTPSTAPVGTTLAVQSQALQVFSAIYKRIYRGFRDEFQMMYRAIRRWATDAMRKEYAELTGGDLDQDFAGDGTDIQPVADPTVVTKMQKIARLQTIMQIAESAVGMAAGMTQPGPAQEIIRDAMDVLDVQRPDRFFAVVPPNPIEQAKAADMEAAAKLKTADAELRGVEAHNDTTETAAKVTHLQTRSVRELGLAAKDTHDLHQEADRVARTGTVAEPEQLIDPAAEAEKDRKAAAAAKQPEGPQNAKQTTT